ncbi:MAG: hypothetical protein U0X40_11620 [Ferruginibacter sp.]
MRFRFCLSLVLLLSIPVIVPAQDITGLWKGYLHNDTTGKNLRYELAISENKGKLSGFSHTFFIVDDREYFGVKRVKVRREDDKIIIQEVELLSNNYPIPPAKGVHQLDVLTLGMKDSAMVLAGPFTTNRTREYHPLTGSVFVERKLNYRQSALLPHLEELGLSKDLSFVKPEEENIAEISSVAEPEVYAIPVNALTSNNNANLIIKQHQAADIQLKVDTAAAKPQPVAAAPVAVQQAPVKKPAVTPASQPATQPVAAAPKPRPAPVSAAPVTTATPAAVASNQPVNPAPVKAAPAVIPQNTVTPVTADVASEVGKRTIQTIQSVYFKSDSLQLTLYDNGEVDGDTVSVLMNGQVIMPKVGLSTRAIRKTIYITPDMPDSIQLIMYAENLGSIPPNTGLLVVHDGEDTYEIRFSGDYKKNAAIIFRRRK